MNNMRTFLLCVCCLVYGQVVLAQDADVTRGCVPLTVNFTAPTQSTYFWDFDNNGASSDQAAPEHIFAQAGTYEVKLYRSIGGTLIGNVTITVYPDIQIQIDNDIDLGCIPLDVQFSSNITAHPDIDIEDIIWTFGDGAIGNGGAPGHIYTFGDIFDVSVQVVTDLDECNKTVNFDDIVEAEDLNSDIIFPEISCDVPIEVEIQPSIAQNPDHDYFWDFGNGTTSTSYLPEAVTFSDLRTYNISLLVTSSTGCEVLNETELTVGPPKVTLNYPDTVCVDDIIRIENLTQANRYEWTIGEPAFRSFKKNIEVSYPSGGLKPIRLIATYDVNCFTDTTIFVYVEDPNAEFYLEPGIGCTDNQEFTLVAEDASHERYIWGQEVTTEPTYTIAAIDERDSLYINVQEINPYILTVVSENGCRSSFDTAFNYMLTEAYFIPDRVVGVNSLSVNFEDLSTSENEIVRRHWYFGDGTDMEVPADQLEVRHPYTRCGVFFPYLEVEDSKGCIDISKRVRIDILCVTGGDGGGGMCTPSATEGCVGEPITFNIVGPTFLDYHIKTDDDRMSHCWRDLMPIHSYTRPGTYPVDFIVEYRGIILAEVRVAEIEISGAYADAEFKTNCDNIYEVEFLSNSEGEEELSWTYKEEVLSTRDKFKHTFTELGEHIVYLEAENITSGCPPDMDSVIVYITEPEAAFRLPLEMCDSEQYTLDASASKDVFSPCYKGFLWEFEFQRPREVGDEQLRHQFARGKQTVTLTVEDINGCTDSATASTNVYGIEPNFTLDSTTCLPYPIDIQNLTDADTTIVSWDWSFGSTLQNPSHVFDSTDIHEDHPDSILVELAIEDALGCTDNIEKWVRVVEPAFFIGADIGARACVGQQINLTAVDTSDIISSYDFFWDFGGIARDTGETISFAFPEEGIYTIRMNFRHKNGTCDDVVEKIVRILPSPDAAFTSDIDDEDIVCYPAQITFFTDPEFDNDNYTFDWDFGNGDASSELPQPSIEFGQGTHDVQLVITNEVGCTDTITRDFTLVGPEGVFTTDKQIICLGESITFTMSDTAFVSDYIWDFGDGNTIANQNPVTHTYSLRPPGDSTLVQLILKSTKFACEVNVDLPIFINEVNAEIDATESLAFCDGQLIAGNLSTGADNFLWDFGDGTTSTDLDPDKIYDDPNGTFTVILTAIDNESGCEDRDTIIISPSVGGLPDDEKIMPNTFSPNNDSANDFFKPALSASLGESYTVRTFKVYNRWGQLVFDNEDTNGWSGRYEGKESPPEVYAYFVELDNGCTVITEKGSVTLVR